jgi:hypothetical protein
MSTKPEQPSKSEQPPKPEQSPDSEPHLTGIEYLVHEAIRMAYASCGAKNQNSSCAENRPLTVKVLDFAQLAPYGAYYLAYHTAKAIDCAGAQLGDEGKAISQLIVRPLAQTEAAGLIGSELLGYAILKLNHGRGNMYQDITGTVVPQFAWPNAPRLYIPGIHWEGPIDFEGNPL